MASTQKTKADSNFEVKYHLGNGQDISSTLKDLNKLCHAIGFKNLEITKIQSCISDIYRDFLDQLEHVELSAKKITQGPKKGIYFNISGKLNTPPSLDLGNNIYRLLKDDINEKIMFFDNSDFSYTPCLELELIKWVVTEAP